jgi:hypothetical protein
MTNDPSLQTLDYTSIQYPSDRITVGDIRRTHPERFDSERAELFNRTGNDPNFAISVILYLERLLAHAAYEDARGKGVNVFGPSGLDREDCLEELTQFYALYGVAQGTHHTEQLVRDIEAQAAAQVIDRPR